MNWRASVVNFVSVSSSAGMGPVIKSSQHTNEVKKNSPAGADHCYFDNATFQHHDNEMRILPVSWL